MTTGIAFEAYGCGSYKILVDGEEVGRVSTTRVRGTRMWKASCAGHKALGSTRQDAAERLVEKQAAHARGEGA